MKKALMFFRVIAILAVLVTINIYYSATIVRAEEIQETLSKYDKNRHSPKQFLAIIDEIRQYARYFTKGQVGDWIVIGHKEIKKYFPDITLYDAAQEIKDTAKRLGEDSDMRTIVDTYIINKTKDIKDK